MRKDQISYLNAKFRILNVAAQNNEKIKSSSVKCKGIALAEPGFPRRMAPTLEIGVKTYYLARVLPKTA